MSKELIAAIFAILGVTVLTYIIAETTHPIIGLVFGIPAGILVGSAAGEQI